MKKSLQIAGIVLFSLSYAKNTNAQVIADRYGELTRVLRFYIDTASGTGDAALRARRVRGRAAAGARVEPGAAGGHHARLWPGAARR